MADAVSPSTNADMQTQESLQRKSRLAARQKWLKRFGGFVIVVALLWAAWYYLVGRNSVSTDNAYVNAEIAQVTPLISAHVIDVAVSDTVAVKKGQILVRLDAANASIAVAQAEADLADARRRFRRTRATSTALSSQVQARAAEIVQSRARLVAARSDAERARIGLARREVLAQSGAVSGEELTTARNGSAAARAALAQAQAEVATAESTRGAARGELAANDALVQGSTEENDPGVLAAKAKLAAARLDLDRTVIRAPIDGVITKRAVQVGQLVNRGTPIMSIVPVARVYVDANFKERQLARVRPGMPATITADIYGSSVVYHGRVVGFSGGTGSSLALIPAQNATGNWIKVVQRLPVRIALDPKQLRTHPLRVGLSTEVEIQLED